MPVIGIGDLFWAAGFFGHILLLVVLVVRRRAKRFPFFTALIASNILRTSVLFLVRHHGTDAAYLWAYMVLGSVDVALQVAVAYEVASHVFRPLGRWAPDIRRGMFWLGWGSLAIASGLTWMASSGAAKWQFTVLIKANFFSATLLSQLFLGMLVLSTTVGLPWRTHVVRIGIGLGTYSILDVLIEAAHTLYSGIYKANISETLTWVRMVLYLGVLAFWIVSLWHDAPEPRELSDEMREQLSSLQSRLAYDLYTIRNWRKL